MHHTPEDAAIASAAATANALLAGIGMPGADYAATAAGAAEARGARRASLAPKTRTNIENHRQWFQAWCDWQEVQSMPPSPDTLSRYFAYRSVQLTPEQLKAQRAAKDPATKQGWKPGTVQNGVSALHRLWKEQAQPGEPDPFQTIEVVETLAGIRRQLGVVHKQSLPLTNDILMRVRATAMIPRRTRKGRIETIEYAQWRGIRDLAMLHLFHDAALRSAELVALTWDDISRDADNSGLVYVARSKTDQEGEGAWITIRASVADLLDALRPPDIDGSTPVFPGYKGKPMTWPGIIRIIRHALKAAGIPNPERYTAHAGRIGFIHDAYVTQSAPLPQVMNHGRWKTPTMPAYYARAFSDRAILGYLGDDFDPLIETDVA